MESLDQFCFYMFIIVIILFIVVGIPFCLAKVIMSTEKQLFLTNNKNKYDKIKKDYLKRLNRYQKAEAINDDINKEYILVDENNLYVLKKLYNIEYYHDHGKVIPTELESIISFLEIRYFSLEGGVSSQQLGGKTIIVLNDNHRTITISSPHAYDLLLDHIPEKEYSNYINNKKEKGRK